MWLSDMPTPYALDALPIHCRITPEKGALVDGVKGKRNRTHRSDQDRCSSRAVRFCRVCDDTMCMRDLDMTMPQ
ncbi:hypothetical protein GTY82_12585 [Streptomyces sp. SID5476]|uniref:Uncharacterized protein n=1 Tax=Streptomyces bottropensis ATCC 25435 TaxID=1054862 RepID=M3F776_9ACTN|nr:hypothetical protein SBD_0155 [Streptomyces bottropensis ATCC 25435]MZD18038.1 hypothetical protein [Streptomyces sp. SID5476]